jgi:glycosyltransferase involved in cell wall biosynthesis
MERLLCLLSNMNRGGAETFLMKVYRALDRTRYQMDFCIVLEEKCDYEDEILAMGGRIYRIPPKTRDMKAFNTALFDLIHDHHYRSVLKITSNAAGFWDLKIAKQAGAVRTIARSSNSGDGDSRAQLIAHRISRILWMKYADVKLAPSDLAAGYTFGKRALSRGEVHLLNNGLDLGVYHFSDEARSRIRAELGAGEKTAVLGHVGRFNTQKNHTFLIRVFAEYYKRNADSLLVLVGVGDLEPQLRQQVKAAGLENKVIFTGLRTDIPALLSAFDLFVFPSLYEGMPNTVIEAQACSLPCVLADTVTRQADLCGRLRYLPLTDAALWADAVGDEFARGRVCADMSAYDIRAVADQFRHYCFDL